MTRNEQTTPIKYRATIKQDGRECVVLPRSKKTGLFRTVQAAFNALEKAGRNLTHDAQGWVRGTDGSSNTIAL